MAAIYQTDGYDNSDHITQFQLSKALPKRRWLDNYATPRGMAAAHARLLGGDKSWRQGSNPAH